MGRVWEVTCSFPMDTWCDLVCAHNDKEYVEAKIIIWRDNELEILASSFWYPTKHFYLVEQKITPTNAVYIIPKVWRSTVSYFAVLCWTCKGKSEIGNFVFMDNVQKFIYWTKTLIIKTNRILWSMFAEY